MKIRHVVFIVLIMSISVTVSAADSQNNREKYNFLFSVAPWALSNGTPASFSYTISMYFNKNLSLNVNIGRLNDDYETGDSEKEISYSSISFGGRYFFGSSLNVLSGIHHRKWIGKKNIKTASNGYGEAEIEATSSAMFLGIGNQWVADFGLTWGLDWVVLAFPMSSSSSVKISENDGLTSDEVNALKDSSKETADSINNVATASAAVIFSIGWSF